MMDMTRQTAMIMKEGVAKTKKIMIQKKKIKFRIKTFCISVMMLLMKE
jgi:hypothetical protein